MILSSHFLRKLFYYINRKFDLIDVVFKKKLRNAWKKSLTNFRIKARAFVKKNYKASKIKLIKNGNSN